MSFALGGSPFVGGDEYVPMKFAEMKNVNPMTGRFWNRVFSGLVAAVVQAVILVILMYIVSNLFGVEFGEQKSIQENGTVVLGAIIVANLISYVLGASAYEELRGCHVKV